MFRRTPCLRTGFVLQPPLHCAAIETWVRRMPAGGHIQARFCKLVEHKQLVDASVAFLGGESNCPIVVGKVTLVPLFLVAQFDLKIFSPFLRFRRSKRCHFVLFFWFYECLSNGSFFLYESWKCHSWSNSCRLTPALKLNFTYIALFSFEYYYKW